MNGKSIVGLVLCRSRTNRLLHRYHGKCMKIARGKVKEFDKYTCPICDWRVKIPRDAARPRLEDLLDWQAEISSLPFQPDEEECLSRIINQAQDFRDFIRMHTNPAMTTQEEVPTQRFYLRKIEGAEILLSWETNFFRQELHKWAPVAPEAPPVLEVSLSTRKPRPTKQQKLMAQLGIENPDDLPQSLRTKQHSFGKRKSSEPNLKQPPLLQPAPGRSTTPTSQGHSASTSGTASNMNAPFGPPTHGSSYGYDGQFMASPSQESPTFAEAGFMNNHPNLASPSFDGHSPRASAIDTTLFPGPNFGRNDQPTTDEGSPGPTSYSNPEGGNVDSVDSIFDDLTNEEADGVGSSHATEALAVIGDANSDDEAGDGDESMADQY